MEEALKIGIICHPTAGGSGVVAAELTLALAERGHELHVFSYERPFRLLEPRKGIEIHEVAVTRYPLFKYPPYTLALATKLARICAAQPLDILHVHYAIPHAVSAYLCRQMLGPAAPKIVTTLHGTDITLIGFDESFYDITRFSILESDTVTAVSESLSLETRERLDVDREIEVIMNFVDTDEFSPDKSDPSIRARYARCGEALIGHMSNFRTTKRLCDVVRVFHRIADRLPARLLLIGDGPDRERARVLAEELGVAERVVFVGAEEEVASLLAQLDLFLLPSEKESFGLAALEAMASGVPVIANRIGGLPELVEDSVSGYLTPLKDTAAMADRAIALLSDRDLHQRFSQASLERARVTFSRDAGVERYEACYRATLAK